MQSFKVDKTRGKELWLAKYTTFMSDKAAEANPEAGMRMLLTAFRVQCDKSHWVWITDPLVDIQKNWVKGGVDITVSTFVRKDKPGAGKQ